MLSEPGLHSPIKIQSKSYHRGAPRKTKNFQKLSTPFKVCPGLALGLGEFSRASLPHRAQACAGLARSCFGVDMLSSSLQKLSGISILHHLTALFGSRYQIECLSRECYGSPLLPGCCYELGQLSFSQFRAARQHQIHTGLG